MCEKTLKFDNVAVNKKEFRASKKPIALNFVDIDKIVISDKFKHNDKGFKYFIGYLYDNIMIPLCIILLQMNGYIKYLADDGKICLLKLKMIVYWQNIMKSGIKLKRR